MNKKYIVTWDMIQIYTRKLAKKLLSQKLRWKRIFAISRGGLVPSAILSRELNIKYIDTICISSYSHSYHKKNLKILKNVRKKKSEKNILIVDDLADTGRTAKTIKKMYPKSFLVTIFAKPKGKDLVDQYVIDIKQDVWIEQPWDMKLVYSDPIIRK